MDKFTNCFNLKKNYSLILIILLFVFSSCSNNRQKEIKVSSPDGNYSFSFLLKEQLPPTYSVAYKNSEVIGSSNLGFKMVDEKTIIKDIRVENITSNSVDTIWKPLYGEKSKYPEVYEETLITLSGTDALFDIRVRAYNEGVAFRYEFHGNRKETQIKKELTEFSLSPKANVWAAIKAQKEIIKVPISNMDSIAERPLLIQLPDSLFVALGEAALVNYARMKFAPKRGKPGTLVSELSSKVKLSNTVNKTPWRFVMAAETPGELLENNYLLLNLNEPNKILDTSWIRPGKIIRESTLTTIGGIACVDFAAKHNLQYIEFDAGWYGNEYDDASDATTITIDPKRSKGPLDLHAVIDYAKSKDIGVILYVNRRSLEKQLDAVLPLLKSWGVSGIKYGFVNVGSQEWTSWLHDAVRKAADHGLMIDVHDEYRPTGYSRTYPNLMTQEGIRGDEESPKNSEVLNTLFTRMLAGAGDQTNCYFAPRVTEEMGSHVSQLAKAVCIYSPWQFLYWYDRPEGSETDGAGAGGTKTFIKEVPELAFYDALPTVWDDTRILDGYPGEYAIVARKSGEDWFVAALSGESEKQIDISLDFLEKGKKYEAVIYSDDKEHASQTKVNIENRKVNANDIIGHTLLKQNGLAIHIKVLDN